MRMLGAAMAACLALSSLSAPAALAQAPQPMTPSPAEHVFTPVYPCRVFDTRKTSRIAARATRNFFIAGRENYAGQGGVPNGCGVPLWATAVAISLSATGPSAAGYLIPHAFGGSRPDVVALSYQPSNAATTAGTTAPIRNGKLSIYASQATHVIGDVTGYFAPQITASVKADGSFLQKTSRVISAQRSTDSVGYSLTIDRDVTSCVASATPNSIFYVASVEVFDRTEVRVTVFQISSSHLSADVVYSSFKLVVTC